MVTRECTPEDELRYKILKYTSINLANVKYEAKKFYANDCKFPNNLSAGRHRVAYKKWNLELITAGFWIDHCLGLRVIIKP